MAKDSSLARITEIIVDETVNKKMPTVVFLYEKKEDLVDYILRALKSDHKELNEYKSEDWKELSEIVDTLSATPLLLKQTTDIDDIKKETENFIAGMEGKKGLVIIHSKENISEQEFINLKDNISIIILNSERG